MSSDQMPLDDMQVDKENLYREESFTDLRMATLRRLTPIKIDGSDDPSRPLLFIGSTQVMSQMGPVPIQAEIEAATLEEAMNALPAALKKSIEEMIEQAREMQREQANRIVVPDGRPGGAPGKQGGGVIQI